MANIPNLDRMPLRELLDLEIKLAKAIAGARERERAEVKHKIESLVQTAGFSMNDLYGGRGRGKVSPAKYANPDNRAETWTGRGRKPNWLINRLAKGGKIDDFGIR